MSFGDETVEAIEDGKIVRVSRDYAIREGLLILKKHEEVKLPTPEEKQPFYSRYKSERPERRVRVDLDRYRKPLRSADDVTSTLIPNFSWVVSSKRKEKNLSRKQLSEALHVLEEDLKMVELGRLPKNDYVLVNKLEDFLGVVLRKDPSVGRINLEPKQNKESRFLKTQKSRFSGTEGGDTKLNSHMLGDDIEIIDSVD